MNRVAPSPISREEPDWYSLFDQLQLAISGCNYLVVALAEEAKKLHGDKFYDPVNTAFVVSTEVSSCFEMLRGEAKKYGLTFAGPEGVKSV